MTITLDLDPEVLAEALHAGEDACSFDSDDECQTHDFGARRSDDGCAVATVAAAVRRGRLYPQRTTVDPHADGSLTVALAAPPRIVDLDTYPDMPDGATEWERGTVNRTWVEALRDLREVIVSAAERYGALTTEPGDRLNHRHWPTGLTGEAIAAEVHTMALSVHLDGIAHRLANLRDLETLAAGQSGEDAARWPVVVVRGAVESGALRWRARCSLTLGGWAGPVRLSAGEAHGDALDHRVHCFRHPGDELAFQVDVDDVTLTEPTPIGQILDAPDGK